MLTPKKQHLLFYTKLSYLINLNDLNYTENVELMTIIKIRLKNKSLFCKTVMNALNLEAFLSKNASSDLKELGFWCDDITNESCQTIFTLKKLDGYPCKVRVNS